MTVKAVVVSLPLLLSLSRPDSLSQWTRFEERNYTYAGVRVRVSRETDILAARVGFLRLLEGREGCVQSRQDVWEREDVRSVKVRIKRRWLPVATISPHVLPFSSSRAADEQPLTQSPLQSSSSSLSCHTSRERKRDKTARRGSRRWYDKERHESRQQLTPSERRKS